MKPYQHENIMKPYQQGDVLLHPIAELPDGCSVIKQDSRGTVLAEGEVTGHYHGIDRAMDCTLLSGTGGRTFLKTGKKAAILKHQEHKEISLPPNTIFEVGGVREKDWFADMVRKVID